MSKYWQNVKSRNMRQYMTKAQGKEHGEIQRLRCRFGRESWEGKEGRWLDWEAVVRPGQKSQGNRKALGFWRKSPPIRSRCVLFVKPEKAVLKQQLLPVVVEEVGERLRPIPGHLSHKTLTPIEAKVYHFIDWSWQKGDRINSQSFDRRCVGTPAEQNTGLFRNFSQMANPPAP